MATVSFSTGACEIGLTHDETNNLLSTLASFGGAGGAALISGLFVKFGIAAALGASGPFIAAAIAAHVTWELIVIKASDNGDGVWLHAPPEIWMNGGFGLVIPHTRTASIDFDGRADDGTMHSQKADEITWHIDRGVGSPDDCKFVLINECDWGKAYKLYIDQDTWWVEAGGHQTAENGAWYQRSR